MEFHKLGGLNNNRNVLSQLWRLEVHNQVSAGPGTSDDLREGPLPGLSLAAGIPWLVAA